MNHGTSKSRILIDANEMHPGKYDHDDAADDDDDDDDDDEEDDDEETWRRMMRVDQNMWMIDDCRRQYA